MLHCGFTLHSVMSLVTCHCLLTCPLAPPPLDHGHNGLIKYIVSWPWTQNWGWKGTNQEVTKNKICYKKVPYCPYKTVFGNQDGKSVLCWGLCERKKMVEFLVVVMECFSGDNLVCQYPFACFQVTFQENLTIKILRQQISRIFIQRRDFSLLEMQRQSKIRH